MTLPARMATWPGLMVLAATLTVAASFLIFSGLVDIVDLARFLDVLAWVASILSALFLVMIIRELRRLFTMRRMRGPGSRLQSRLVLLFAVLAALPALVVAVFSYLFLETGLNVWFAGRTQTAIAESTEVAQAYLSEHRRNIATDALRIASDINSDPAPLRENPRVLDYVLKLHASLRNVSEALIVEGETRRVQARAGFSLLLELDPLPERYIARARSGETVILDEDFDDRVRALVKLDVLNDSFLYIGRLVEPQVLARIEQTAQAEQEYQELLSFLPKIRLSFALSFVLIGMVLLYGAIAVARLLAGRLVNPLVSLISATEKIAAGELDISVSEHGSGIDETRTLARAFNRMTGELHSRRADLLKVNRDLEERSAFSQAVLAGVTAGVIGLDKNGCINLPNRAASEFLQKPLDRSIGIKLADLVPEMEPLIEAATHRRAGQIVEHEIDYPLMQENLRLLTRVVREQASDGGIIGYVVTFDNISPLIDAQRRAAWSDVARRIAHEIKNPLTPIQLAAERLQRKLQALPVSGDKAGESKMFDSLIETILRQVADVGRLVDSFSNFARMPAPAFSKVQLDEVIRQQVFLEKNRRSDMTYDLTLPDCPLMAAVDPHQIAQLVTNLLKNAAEAIEDRLSSGDDKDSPPESGRIEIEVKADDQMVHLTVSDNGIGLPKGLARQRLSEPYVTTRDRGSGLGLAIVHKILEDHGGGLRLSDRPSASSDDSADQTSGACVEAYFARFYSGPSDSGPSDLTDNKDNHVSS